MPQPLPSRWPLVLLWSVLLWSVLLRLDVSVAQESVAVPQRSTAQVTPVATVQSEGGPPVATNTKTAESGKGTPDSAAGKADGEQKPDENAKKEGQPDSGPVKRPNAAGFVPRKIDEEIRRDPNGTVQFNLSGQPWLDVLRWIADASQLSLDWQELPSDYLNLITTRSYTLPEARDLINRHLLIRGYCIIQRGEILSVLKTKDLNPSLVPRVSAEELTDLPDHTLCKVSFDLNWLLADEAVEELKPMLSSAGQIHKLSRTNRLEILDVASSLRDIRDLLDAEQSQSGTEQLVRTFRLEHRRAEEVIVLLRDLLGIRDDKGSAGSGGMNPGMMQQMQQQMQQMQQQMQQQMASKAGGGTKAKGPAETRLVLNSRENMILAQAAPDQMAIIDQAIQQVDVAQESGRSLLNNMSRMKIYRLETVDPQTLSDLLQQLGDLDPGTVLKVDKSKKAIIAWASLADHLTITTLVEKLDQSGRSVEVIPLRRLEADYVAGTIRALMGPVEKDQNSNRNSSRYFVYGFGMPQQEEEDQSEGFKVEADIEFNRLLVFANNVEMEEIHNLLRKLGELPPKDQAFSGVQSFDLHPDEDLEQLRKRLEFLWQRDNELQFDLPESTTDEPADLPTEDDPAMDDPVVPKNDNQTTAASGASDRPRTFNELLTTRQNKFRSPRNATLDVPVRTRIPQRRPRNAAIVTNQPLQNPAATPQQETKGLRKGAELPNVRISVGPDGRLLVNTDDPEAMLEFEDLFKSISRSRPPYRVFTLKYATPSWVALNLDDYFKAEQETESSMQFDPWFGMRPVEKAVKGKNSLSRRRVPQFITDNFTSTILVRDADARQMQTIQELIELYDVPEPADTRAMRITKLFRLQNAKATSVANAVKDVFRDLLSSNDKALESNDKNQRPSGGFSSFLASMSDDSNEDEPIRFKGLLSIGVDESSNTLIVSSTASLMETLGQMIESLDEAANTTSIMQVIKVDPTVDIQLIQERLDKLLTSPTVQKGNQQPQVPGQQPGNRQSQKPDGSEK